MRKRINAISNKNSGDALKKVNERGELGFTLHH